MSEYQYYEILAVDRPLSEDQQRALRAPSTRVRIPCHRVRTRSPAFAPSRVGRYYAVVGANLEARASLGWKGRKFERITVNPAQRGGVPCIRGLRIPVATVVGMVADGMSAAAILDAYADLVGDDINEALLFAAEAVREREVPLATS